MSTGRVSNLVAAIVWRFRLPMSALLVLGAVFCIPSANITHIDNDITAWFSKDDPVYRDYERFRQEFGGTRTLIVAVKADTPERLFSPPTLRFIQDVTAAIERVETVHRVDSLATATIVEALHGDEDGGLDVRPLLQDIDARTPDEVRRRALGDDLLRGDLVSDSGTVSAIVVSFDEDKIDEVRGGVIQEIHDIVDPAFNAAETRERTPALADARGSQAPAVPHPVPDKGHPAIQQTGKHKLARFSVPNRTVVLEHFRHGGVFTDGVGSQRCLFRDGIRQHTQFRTAPKT